MIPQVMLLTLETKKGASVGFELGILIMSIAVFI